ncbi:MAG: chemotaxis protein CheW [Syntrophus sp. (in: bacteria)]|nr:chemotaxis protein CheW [Syntrophus sp. (in: bacteria)]
MSVNNHDQLAVFTLDGNKYALRISVVERMLRSVEMTSLPDLPDIVSGIINLQGKVIPVFNVRRRFRLPEREMDVSDHLIIARAQNRTVALLVDEVLGIHACMPAEIVQPGEIMLSMEYIEGVVKTTDGMILIHDLNRFLSFDEQSTLDAALSDH